MIPECNVIPCSIKIKGQKVLRHTVDENHSMPGADLLELNFKSSVLIEVS